MKRWPKVFSARAAKAAGNMRAARIDYRKRKAAGQHVHWVANGDHTCRNGEHDACPVWEAQERMKES